jgi:multidrug transporter EmrE-like cation transporter
MSLTRQKVIPYTVLLLSIVLSIAGQLLMKQTMSNVKEGLFSWTFMQQLILALTVYSLGMVNWIFALKFVKLSVAYPLTSLNYIGILLGSYYFFDEKITLMRLLGVGLIFAGVLLVALPISNRRQFPGAS